MRSLNILIALSLIVLITTCAETEKERRVVQKQTGAPNYSVTRLPDVQNEIPTKPSDQPSTEVNRNQPPQNGCVWDARFDSEGLTALHRATRDGDLEITESLLAAGCSVNVKTQGVAMYATIKDRTPLHFAAYTDRADIVMLLLDRGADVNAIDGKLRTPIFDAVFRGDSKIVSMILERKVDVNLKDFISCTPLHHAILEGKKEIVELLLKNGASLEIKDFANRTPLELANGRLREAQGDQYRSEALQGIIQLLGTYATNK